MKKIITLFSILIFSIQVFACLNGETKTLKDGTFIYEDSDGRVPYGHRHFSIDELNNTLKRIDSIYNKTNDIDYLSDKGLIYILLGKYDDAILLYQNLEKTNPNRYSTASNLGTAYELKGDNINALKWIKKSVEIDPKSHHNSEWIHVKILETRINGMKNITSKSLINIDFGDNIIPKTDKNKTELENLYNEIYYQVNERVTFIKPKDKIIAQLYFDLGNIAFLNNRFYDAIENYNQATEYGFSDRLIKQRITEGSTQQKIRETAQNKKPTTNIKVEREATDYKKTGILFLGILILVIVAYLILKKRK